jgi:hypothetical protein
MIITFHNRKQRGRDRGVSQRERDREEGTERKKQRGRDRRKETEGKKQTKRERGEERERKRQRGRDRGEDTEGRGIRRTERKRQRGTVCYHSGGSMKLNACILLLAHMVYL